MRACRNTQPIQVAEAVIDDRFAVDDLQGAVWTDLDTFSRAFALDPIDINFH